MVVLSVTFLLNLFALPRMRMDDTGNLADADQVARDRVRGKIRQSV